MARAEERTEESVKRAELFEILAHQTRIRILRVLENHPLSFGELKRILGMESSGHLQYHLGKLGDLIKQTDDRRYALSDDGKEALRVLEVMRTESFTPISRAPHLPVFGIIMAAVILAIRVALYLNSSYQPARTELPTLLWESSGRLGNPIYYSVYGPTTVYAGDSYKIDLFLRAYGPLDIEYVKLRILDTSGAITELYVEDIWKNLSVSDELVYSKRISFKASMTYRYVKVQIIARVISPYYDEEVDAGHTYVLPESAFYPDPGVRFSPLVVGLIAFAGILLVSLRYSR